MMDEKREEELAEKTDKLMKEAVAVKERGEFGPKELEVLEDALRALGIEYGILPGLNYYQEESGRKG